MNVASVILAAGRSTRFARGNKLLAPVDGVAMIRRVALAVAKSSVSDIVLVVAAGGTSIVDAAGDGRWRAVVAQDAGRGLSASLSAGVSALAPDVDGLAVVLADMPDVSSTLIDQLIAAFEQKNGTKITFPQDGAGRQGHPVVWPRSLFGDLKGLSGDAGGKALLARNAPLCHPVPTNDPGAFSDIDHEQDLADRGRPAGSGSLGGL